MYSIAGAIGLAVRTFSVTNSTVWFTGYFNRYSGNNHTNSASVAVPPIKFGTSTTSPAPALGKFTIKGCSLGAKLYYYNAPVEGTDDYTENCKSSTMLQSSASTAIRGYGYSYEEPYCSSDYYLKENTTLTSAP